MSESVAEDLPLRRVWIMIFCEARVSLIPCLLRLWVHSIDGTVFADAPPRIGIGAIAMSVGYSGTPLHKKLGLRPGMRVLAAGMPRDVREVIESGINGVVWVRQATDFEAAHLFATRLLDLKRQLLVARKALPPTGFIWVSWPKKSSGVATDISEERIRELAFPLKLVDIKVCAVTAIWSGLKLVIRIKDRK